MNNCCLKLPLKKEILIFLSGEILIGQIIFAGKDTLKVKNVKRRVFQDKCFFDCKIAEELILDRSKILGYSHDIEPSCNLNIFKKYTEIFPIENHIKKEECDIISFRRKKMPDELRDKVFEKFDIQKELKEFPTKKVILKPIPKEWFKDLFYFAITKLENISYRLKEDKNSFTLFFNSIKDRDYFENAFRSNFLNSISEFLTEKGENAKDYKRSLICTTIPENLTLKISY